MKKKLPAMPWYVGDWLKDPGVRALTYEERGIYVDLLCLMWENYEQRGFLTLNGRGIKPEILSHMMNLSLEKIVGVLEKLVDVGCLRELRNSALLKTKDLSIHNLPHNSEITPILYNSRMVRDEKLRRERAKGGIKGGNPNFRKGKPNPYYRELSDLVDDNLDDNLHDNLSDNLTHNLDDNLDHNLEITSKMRSVSYSEEDQKEPLRGKKKLLAGDGLNGNRASRMSDELFETLKSNKELIDMAFLECPDIDFNRELLKFRDHWKGKSGKAGLKLDWLATARNWLRTAQEWKDERRGGVMSAAAALAKQDEKNGMSGFSNEPDFAPLRDDGDLDGGDE